MEITKENLTVNNIKSVIRAYSNIAADKTGIKSIPEHIRIQIKLRKAICNDCYNAGKCIKCSCKVPDLFYDPKRVDSLNRWGPMLSEQAFNVFLNSLDLERQNAFDYMAKEYQKLYTGVNDTIKKNLKDSSKVEVVEYDSSITNKDFGKIKQGKPVEHTFKFVNTTNHTLKIKSIVATCGCTVPYYKLSNVKPNEEYEFKIKYDAKKLGKFSKGISVIIDNKNIYLPSFNIQGEVVKK